MKRRDFLKNSTMGTLAAGTLGSEAVHAAPAYNDQILLYIFIRGGIDGCNLVVPLGEKDHEYYSIMRPTLAIPDAGEGAALPINGTDFGFNPVASSLLDLYNANRLAIVQAVGTPDDISSRSHFDAEKYVELGTPGSVGTLSGWLHRHFNSMTNTLGFYPEEIFIPIIAFRNTPPASLLGNNSSLTVSSPGDFRMDNAFWRWSTDEPGYMQLDMLPEIYDVANDEFSGSGAQALAAESLLRTNYDPDYTGSGGIPYADNYIGARLSDVAQMIKLNLGTRIFTLDFNNFDTHTIQNQAQNYNDPVAELSDALAALLDDLDNSGNGYADRTTVIIQSEFGRRIYQNISDGTDHGNGNLMLVLGKQVNGGSIYGQWPGLYPGTADDFVDYPNPKTGTTVPELFQGALSVTTDFRRVLSEYLDVRCQHTPTTREFVFPAYAGYSPMGIFQPLEAVDDMIFKSNFEI